MSLEGDLFKRKWPDFNKLESFGFHQEGSVYTYTCTLPTDEMVAEVQVNTNGTVRGKVIDPFTKEEYVAVHTNTPKGSYAAKIRAEYLQVLEKIGTCFYDVPFISAQMNRLGFWIKEKWKCEPSHPFKKDEDSVVYYHLNGKKWFALIQEITYDKLDEKKSGFVEVITLKKGKHYKETNGIYPAWHMNHAQWISIVLNDTLADEAIEELIMDSYAETLPKTDQSRISSHWIIPANPSYFDVDHAFQQSDILFWKQSTNIRVGDLVFMYYGAPFSELRYLCEVIETDIPYESFYEGPVKIKKEMRIRKLYFFDQDLLNRKLLAQYGVKYVRGPLHIPAKLEEKIIECYPDTAEIIKKEGENHG